MGEIEDSDIENDNSSPYQMYLNTSDNQEDYYFKKQHEEKSPAIYKKHELKVRHAFSVTPKGYRFLRFDEYKEELQFEKINNKKTREIKIRKVEGFTPKGYEFESFDKSKNNVVFKIIPILIDKSICG